MTSFTGFEWLLIDAASMYGLDKELFEDRLAWGIKHLDLYKVKTIVELKANLTDLIAEADEPNMFSANAIAIFDAINGRCSGYPVGMDAAASGPALLSVLGRCVTGMLATGCIDSGSVPDLYTSVQTKLGTGFSRTKVKSAVVPHVYASERAPKDVFGDDYPRFLKAYTETVPMAQWASDALVNAWNSKALVHEWWLPDGACAHVKVVTQTKTRGTIGKGRHYTYIHNINGKLKRGDHGTKALSPNVTHSYDGFVLRELNRRCNYDVRAVETAIYMLEQYLEEDSIIISDDNPEAIAKAHDELKRLEELSKRFNFVSVVALEYIKSEALDGICDEYLETLLGAFKLMLQYPTFELENIHDEFRCLPNHVSQMKQVYNNILAESYQSNWLVETLKDLTGVDHSMRVSPVDHEVVKAILINTYSLN